MYDAIEAIRPGVTTGEVAHALFPDRDGEHMDWYGAQHYWQMTTNQWAHGLGLQLYERPLIWRGISVDHPIETPGRHGRWRSRPRNPTDATACGWRR